MLFNINSYVVPETLDEAYEILSKSRTNIILGGTTFLKLSSRKYNIAIDLSKLNLNNIVETDEEYILGAYVSYGDIERYESLSTFANGILNKSIRHIVGNQFRNIVTVGASVYSRYGFSDFLTALLALNTDVELYKMGRVSLERFLLEGSKKDILVRIYIKKENLKTEFLQLRSSKGNFSLLNLGFSKLQNKYKVVFGARPQRSIIAYKTSEFLSENIIDKEAIDLATSKMLEEVYFGSNSLASSEFRKKLASNLLKRGLCNLEGIDEY